MHEAVLHVSRVGVPPPPLIRRAREVTAVKSVYHRLCLKLTAYDVVVS
jgi:hypothetical protein